MTHLNRRQLLIFFGASAVTTALAPTALNRFLGGTDVVLAAEKLLGFTPVRVPHSLPIFKETPTYLASSIGVGSTLPKATAFEQLHLNAYSPIDDVVVPPEYERYVIVSWGDRVFPNPEEYFGYNCDYTGYVPIREEEEGWLWVNHEYVSYPMSRFAPDTPADVKDTSLYPESAPVVLGKDFPNTLDLTLRGEFLYNLGGSIVRIKKQNDRYQPVSDRKNRRIHGLSGLGINASRKDSYASITGWGTKSYQKGDQNYLIGTGPAVKEVFEAVNADGLGNRIIGTAYNCSGGTTPWGTVVSAEENFQGSADFFIGVTESVKPNGSQTSYTAGTTGAEFGLVGEKYGWMVEIDPADPNFRPRKHTALGRFRHENITVRAEAGRKLVAYMGDDRRGGHTWKFVSNSTVSNAKSKANSRLFENGVLYVAKFNPPSNSRRPDEGTGEWIPLTLQTPTNPISPSVLSSVEFQALGAAQRNGRLPLPRRNGIAGQTSDGGTFNCERTNEATALPGYRNKTLANFYTSQGAVLCDAFLAANLVGGTPTARPEDLEINPKNPREVFIAYTDGAPGGDGYPDSRIFVVAKYSGGNNDTQQYGGLYKIIEDSADSTGRTFKWKRLEQGGEAGSIDGAGFANVDNLAFDQKGNIWGVTDMSTGLHNGFETGAAGKPTDISHAPSGNVGNLVGVFGNNWLFYIPLKGQHAGQVVPFAYGPPRCEMTGPTFVGNTLILSVQHPGEDCPYQPQVNLNRSVEMLALNGSIVYQNRTVPRGSNWPSNLKGNPNGAPKPSVIGIRPKKSGSKFV
ncbi:PhoX family protein [Alkalinema pantanalense CENA528]|uniref:PhoX family protein n=1 Tax=Alkalinema pantanalense TaxID=1620705 RepID=UPI003D6F171E